jgi:16S rRNA processing protein RimM
LNNPGPGNQGKHPPVRDEFVTIARVSKPQGRRGEVAAALFTDFPERFATRKRLFALDARGARRALELEEHWFHKGKVVLKFKGVDSITDAEKLIGCEIQLPLEERAVPEAGTVYVSDLIGCTLYDSGREVGTVEDVQFGAGEAPLLVIKGAREILVPYAAEYVREFLPDRKRIEMKLPAGMLDLDRPVK